MIWPNHCINRSPGAEIVKPIDDALKEWERKGRKVIYIYKGQNLKTEMYSALGAEVPDPEDPRTNINTKVIEFLQQHEQVLVGGQAKSHCVYETVNHLDQHMKTDNRPAIILLEDTTNDISGHEKEYPRSIQLSTTDQVATFPCKALDKAQNHHQVVVGREYRLKSSNIRSLF